MAVHEKSIIVDAPVRSVFRLWRNFENFPQFMSHIKEVVMLDKDTSHWKAKISGIDEEWDAKTTRLQQDKVIAWESTSGLENSGEVRFEPIGEDKTRMTVRIEYKPPAGIVGQAVESVYMGKEVEESIEEDLEHFKERVEA